jgi:hypothetical protein
MELLGCFRPNMVLEDPGCCWCSIRLLLLVEKSSFPVFTCTVDDVNHVKFILSSIRKLITKTFYSSLLYRMEGEAYIQYKAMMITLALHLLLLMFELLVCDKLESRRHIWILVFIPLIFISIISIAICIWAVKNDRSFDVSFQLKNIYIEITFITH